MGVDIPVVGRELIGKNIKTIEEEYGITIIKLRDSSCMKEFPPDPERKIEENMYVIAEGDGKGMENFMFATISDGGFFDEILEKLEGLEYAEIEKTLSGSIYIRRIKPKKIKRIPLPILSKIPLEVTHYSMDDIIKDIGINPEIQVKIIEKEDPSLHGYGYDTIMLKKPTETSKYGPNDLVEIKVSKIGCC